MGYLLAFMFDRIIALWVFNASLITSTVLIPIFAALFWQGRKTPAAGVCSFLFGLLSVFVYYFGIAELGVYDDVWGTYIWNFTFRGETYSLWQEYSLFFSLPISALGFLIGNLFGTPYEPKVLSGSDEGGPGAVRT